ncbi:LacI family DNA-binding transcriptional regulator [Brachybacterium sp. AOP24-D1-21]|uniref:LacI family DNA-binding transcriptional regulator n=1 Tax=Brachybacterium sp. AOP24-D1-21 TaxID=3457711 RepID=UPI00403425D4
MTDSPDVSARRVTRADVARFAGVSTAVVSYVLNNGPRPVAEDTRRRVLEAVQMLGYRPNASARALNLGTTSQICLIAPGVSNPFFAWLTDRVEAEARARGLSVVIVTSADESIVEAVSRVSHQSIDAVMISNEVPATDLAALGRSGIPTILLNQPADVVGMRSVNVDRYRGARFAVEHLVGHGHQSIGYIGPVGPQETRWRGWHDSLESFRLPEGPSIEAVYSREAGYRAAHELTALSDQPSALFVASDELATGVMLGLHEGGVRVPEDIALVSFDGTQETRFSIPPITSVTQPVDEMVRHAFDLLTTEATSEVIRLVPELVLRSSCGCPPRPSQ